MTEPTVRLLPRAEYNNLSPGQRDFYNDLIAQGKAKIVEGTPQPKTEKKDAPESDKERIPDPINRFKGKKVAVSLTTLDHLEGTLSEIWRFEVVLLTANGPLTILKHAIVSLREVS